MAAFDVARMRKDGYSEADIAAALASQQRVDVARLRKDGYSDADIISALNKPQATVKPRGTGQAASPKAAAPQRNYKSWEVPFSALANVPAGARAAFEGAKEFASDLPKNVPALANAINQTLTGAGDIVAEKIGTKKFGNAIEDALTPKGLKPRVQKYREQSRQTAKAVGEGYKESYGDWERIKRTAAERPLDFLGDASLLLTGGGGALARAPGIAGRAGAAVARTGAAIDPLNLAVKGLEKTAQGVDVLARGAIAIPTGAGYRDIGEAARLGAEGKSLADLKRQYTVEGAKPLAKTNDPEEMLRRKSVKKLTKGVVKPLELAEEIAAQRAAGREPNLIDVLPDAALDRLRTAGTMQTPAKQLLDDYVSKAETNFPKAISEQVTRNVSATPRPAPEVVAEQKQARKTEAREKYAPVYAEDVSVSDEVLSAISGPEGAAALRRAEKGASARRDRQQAQAIRELRRRLAVQRRPAESVSSARYSGAPYNAGIPPEPRVVRGPLGEATETSLRPASDVTGRAVSAKGEVLPYNAGLPLDELRVPAAVLDRVQKAFGEMGRNAEKSLVDKKGDIAAGMFGRQASINKALDAIESLKPARQAYKTASRGIEATEAATKILSQDPGNVLGRAVEGLPPEQLAPGADVVAQTLVSRASERPQTARTLANDLAYGALPERLAKYIDPASAERLATSAKAELARLNRAERAKPRAVAAGMAGESADARGALNVAQGAANLAASRPLAAAQNFLALPFVGKTVAEDMIRAGLDPAAADVVGSVIQRELRPARGALNVAYGLGALSSPPSSVMGALARKYKGLRPLEEKLRSGAASAASVAPLAFPAIQAARSLSQNAEGEEGIRALTEKYLAPKLADKTFAEALDAEAAPEEAQAEETAPEGELTFEEFVDRVMMAESGGDPNAVSPVGATGTMQTMQGTLRDPGFGVAPAKDDSPEEKERVGKDYLMAMLNRYDGDAIRAAVAYNWGPANADQWVANGEDPSELPEETLNYVKKVTGVDLGLQN